VSFVSLFNIKKGRIREETQEKKRMK